MAGEQVLRDLLVLERGAVVAYQAALARGLLGRAATEAVQLLREQDAEHARTLEQLLTAAGGALPPAPAREVPRVAAARSQQELLDYVRELEEIAVAGYYDAQQKLRAPALLVTLARIMAVEGQHLVLARQALGESPVPEPFENRRALIYP